MIVLIASDIHAGPRHLATALACAEDHNADVVVFNGDIVPKTIYGGMVNARKMVALQREYLARPFMLELREFKNRHPKTRIYGDLGNDDFWCNRDLLIEAEEVGTLKLLHDRVQTLSKGVDIVGYMFVPPTPFGIKDAERFDVLGAPLVRDATLKGIFSVPNGMEMRAIAEFESIEEDLGKLERRIRRPFILATHAPPAGFGLDVLYDGRGVGSIAIRDFIERQAYKGNLIAAFSGHIHESFEISGVSANEVNGRWVINAGQLDDQLRYVVFDLGTGNVNIKTDRLM